MPSGGPGEESFSDIVKGAGAQKRVAWSYTEAELVRAAQLRQRSGLVSLVIVAAVALLLSLAGGRLYVVAGGALLLALGLFLWTGISARRQWRDVKYFSDPFIVSWDGEQLTVDTPTRATTHRKGALTKVEVTSGFVFGWLHGAMVLWVPERSFDDEAHERDFVSAARALTVEVE